MDSDGYTVPTGPDELNDELKICEKCLGQYNRFAIRKLCQNCEQQQKSGFCEDCQRKYGINNEEKHLELKQQYEELDRKYEIVVEENENLRLGMHEILTKLREYDAESDNIVIDAPTLEKLLHALDARSVSGWYNPAMRIQNELIASKEREIVLKNQVRISENILRNRQPFSDTKIATVKDEDDAKISPQSLPKDYDKEILQQPHTDDDPNILKDVPKFLQEYFFVKNKEIDELTSKLNESIEKYRDNQLRCDELKVYEERVREVFNSLNNSEDEKELLVAKQYEALMKCEAEIKIHQRKVEFLTGDNQYLDKMSKSQKEQSNTLIFELQKQLIEQQKIIKQYQKHKYSIVLKNVNQFNEQQQNEITKLKLKLSQLTGIFVKYLPSIDEKNPTQINFEKLQTYGIIDNENIVQFITRFEYQTLEEKCQIAEKRCNELQLENKYLVELLDVHKNQINKQQEMISKTSEDDITLRHLVVDMQSTTNEKYIIAKQCRENQQIKESNDQLLNENQKLQQQISQLKNEIEIVRIECQSREDSYQNSLNSTELKLKFVTKSLAELRQNYSQFMPLYPIIDFVQDYTNLLELSRTMEQQQQQTSIQKMQHTDLADMIKYLQDHGNDTEMEDKIQILKYQMQCKHLENQLRLFVNQIDELKSMVDQQKMREINWTQHWNTIQLLFEENQVVTATTILIHKECQTTNDVADKCFNTDLIEVALSSETIPDPQKLTPNPTLLKSPTRRPDHEQHNDRNANKSLESQLKQAMILASTRSGLLLETENRLAIAQSRIKVLERTIEENEHQLKEERENLTRKHTQIKDDSVLSVTITSLQNLLMEKDNNLVRFQELLRGERQDRAKSYTDYKNEIKDLQGTVDMLEIKIKTKDREIESVRSKLNDTMQKLSDEYERSSGRSEIARSHFKEEYLSDKCIEDMFLNERNVFDVDHGFETADLQNKIKDKEGEIKMLQTRLRDVNNRGKLWEKSLMEKDKEIAELNQKLNENQLDFKDISESISSRREIEQLREMLEEKDRHINDLTDTLTHFHDDQQRYINDTTIDNAEQVSQLSADLNRSEATNRILTTQLDALKRQIVNVTQREKQARDLVKSFKTQLIKRPVISVKTERPTINREEHLQKRIHQLENDLMIAKEELRKQTNLAQSRRAKDAAELALWDKQKRFQQLADNLKLKLSERESEVEKFKSNFNTAKMTISRLEREKHILENRLRSTNRYCQSPSCPNLHATKYTPAESPESYMTTQSDFGCLINPTESGGNKSIAVVSTVAPPPIDLSASQEIIEVLKARIENQQRKIISMELNAKGGNAMTVEFEKIQEKLANAEAQNVRLEARNLQLQLDVDILRQGDNEDRNQRQIKHLEDYILALKNELSHALAANGLNGIGNGSNTNSAQMEQTILALRGIVEKLKVENKNLKDGKKISVNTSNVSKEMFDKQRNEIEKLQQTYSEALDKISALQIELEIQSTTCTKCKEIVAKHAIAMSHGNDSKNIELNSIKEKLIQKTQLLEKAKILLTRAAAKEKHFREQIIYWKRRCSELQNVPVIDEASESG